MQKKEKFKPILLPRSARFRTLALANIPSAATSIRPDGDPFLQQTYTLPLNSRSVGSRKVGDKSLKIK